MTTFHRSMSLSRHTLHLALQAFSAVVEASLIKYIGSKRRLVGVLGGLLSGAGAKTALDLFSGTTRVGQEFKRRGAYVTAVDTARYSEVFGQCYLEVDSGMVDSRQLHQAVDRLNALAGRRGYFTETFCEASRFFRPENGEKVDAIREAIQSEYAGSPLYPVLLTSLIEAADRVDSTTGVQMAYIKQWAPRAYKPLELRVPDLLPGSGLAIRGDALGVVSELPGVDLAYLDPPYNQHRYFTNYHIWETLVAWDQPEHYGIACKRVDARTEETKSVFNKKREMPLALREVIGQVRARVVVLSYNDEAWISLEELQDMMAPHGHVVTLAFDSKRYVGAQIGIHNPKGEKVGKISHLRNLEYVLVGGQRDEIERICKPYSLEVDSPAQPSLFG